MVKYWPVAKYTWVDAFGKQEGKLYTTNPAKSLQEAVDQFALWEQDYRYHIIDAWIDVEENGKEARLDVERAWRVKRKE